MSIEYFYLYKSDRTGMNPRIYREKDEELDAFLGLSGFQRTDGGNVHAFRKLDYNDFAAFMNSLHRFLENRNEINAKYMFAFPHSGAKIIELTGLEGKFIV